MPKMKEIICKCGCGKKKMVRTADIKRGWGLFFSKSCKAKWQEKRTGQYKCYLRGNYSSKAKNGIVETELATSFYESTAITNKLYCSSCGKGIKKGSQVVFELAESKMINAFCSICGDEYTHEIIMDSIHPFSSEALGQW